MTPKEKARELVDKFYLITELNGSCTITKHGAKQCALIAVDEILEILSEDINPLVNYWFEVKQEIDKL
jgi:hypothetical protein